MNELRIKTAFQTRNATRVVTPLGIAMALSACGGGGSPGVPSGSRSYDTVLQRADGKYELATTVSSLTLQSPDLSTISIGGSGSSSDQITVDLYASGTSFDVLTFNFSDPSDTVILGENSLIKGFSAIEVVGGTVDASDVDLPSSIVAVTINSGLIFSASELKHFQSVGGTGDFVISLTNSSELQALEANISSLSIAEGISASVSNSIAIPTEVFTLLEQASIAVTNPELTQTDDDSEEEFVEIEETSINAFVITDTVAQDIHSIQFFVNWDDLSGQLDSLESFDFKLSYDSDICSYVDTRYATADFMVAINSDRANSEGEVAVSGFSLDLANGFVSENSSFILNNFAVGESRTPDGVIIQVTDIFLNGVAYQDISYELIV
jgi:hypothetical protein